MQKLRPSDYIYIQGRHQHALAHYPQVTNEMLSSLPSIQGSSLEDFPLTLNNEPFHLLFLKNNRIDAFLILLDKGYKVYLPSLVEHNPLNWISLQSNAVCILEQIKLYLCDAAYIFLSNQALNQARSLNEPILVWLIRKNKLSDQQVSNLTSQLPTALDAHFLLYQQLFSDSKYFFVQEAAIRIAFIYVLNQRLLSQDEYNLRLNMLYSVHHPNKTEPTILLDLLWGDIQLLHKRVGDIQLQKKDKSGEVLLNHVRKICVARSVMLKFSESFWLALISNYSVNIIKGFIDSFNVSNDSLSKCLLIMLNKLELNKLKAKSAAIFYDKLPMLAANVELQDSLMQIALIAANKRGSVDFGRRLLTESSHFIPSNEFRRFFLQHAIATRYDFKSFFKTWYSKQYHHLGDLFDDCLSVGRLDDALVYISEVADNMKSKNQVPNINSYSANFLERLVSSNQLNTRILDIMYPTFVIEHVNALNHYLLNHLDTKNRACFDMLLMKESPVFFFRNIFIQQKNSVRQRALERLFVVCSENQQRIESHLCQWYTRCSDLEGLKAEFFYWSEICGDLQQINQSSWAMRIRKTLELKQGKNNFFSCLRNSIPTSEVASGIEETYVKVEFVKTRR